MSDPKTYYFELPEAGRPGLHSLDQYWYPEVQSTWEYATSSRIFDSIFGVKAIAIHATAGSSSWGAMSVMKGGNASWHWLVPDENEKAHGKFAWACAPEARAAWHIRNAVSHPYINGGQNKINHWSLGVEVVNRQVEGDSFSDWQVDMTAKIVRYAWAKYPNLKYVFSHALVDPHRRSDPGRNFDWASFKSRVISGPRETESFAMTSGFEDVESVKTLQAVKQNSLCGEDPLFDSSVSQERAILTQDSDIDWDMSLILAEASQAVYSDEDTVKAWAKEKFNTQQVEFFDRKDTQFFIAENEKNTFIVFRGTKGFDDWIANLKINRTKKPYGKIHKGFFKAFSVVQSEVFAALTRARVFNREVYIGGHSLGGALAAIAAAHSHYEIGSTPIKGIYTFGMPRSFSRSAVNFINSTFGSNFVRFVNDDDIVPKIPPFSRHAGKLVKFNKRGEIKKIEAPKITRNESVIVDDSMSEDEFKNLQKRHAKRSQNRAVQEFASASDHMIARYIDIIRTFAEK